MQGIRSEMVEEMTEQRVEEVTGERRTKVVRTT
jgi:hypothetical protein